MKGHAERLTALDTAFLHTETPTHHMHVGAVFVFEPTDDSTFTFERFLRLVQSRIHLVPRHRQKLMDAPMGLGVPSWVDDPGFDLAYHVRHAALPAPGGRDQLLQYAARLLSRQLDRSRPLWELYVVEGLADGAIAMIGKNHHAMVDGLVGVDIMNVLLDDEATADQQISPPVPWDARPVPSRARALRSAVATLVDRPSTAVSVVRRAVDRPLEAIGRATAVGRGIASTAQSLLGLAPRSVLNQEPGMQRRLATQDVSLAHAKAVKDAFGTTVHDVLLAACGDALGRYLRHRHQDTEGMDLRAMVPVSVTDGDHHNHVTAVFVDLPVDEMDPVARLRRVAARTTEATASHQAMGADAIVNLTGFAPATLQAMAARAATSQRLYNVLVTNVPGPQHPVLALGARLVGMYPFVPLVGMQALGIGMVSLDGVVQVGFTADWDAVADLSILPDMLAAALDDLYASATAMQRLGRNAS